MEKGYFEANLAEARSYSWEETNFPETLDHSHCLVCTIAVPEEGNAERTVYRSRGGWLCKYCFNRFFNSTNDPAKHGG